MGLCRRNIRNANRIIFTNVTEHNFDQFKPIPAKLNIPQWYKDTESYMGGKKQPNGKGQTTSTIKRCMPVFDALTQGYLLLTYTDIFVSLKDGYHWFEWPHYSPLEFHPIEQGKLHPSANGQDFPKWINPWGITTPKGYSTLFIQPVHRPSIFKILEGIVDTDSYVNSVNFPFVMTDPKFEGLIPAGTPVAQVIPIKRDNWQMSFGGEKEIQAQKILADNLRNRFFDKYKIDYRKPKEFN